MRRYRWHGHGRCLAWRRSGTCYRFGCSRLRRRWDRRLGRRRRSDCLRHRGGSRCRDGCFRHGLWPRRRRDGLCDRFRSCRLRGRCGWRCKRYREALRVVPPCIGRDPGPVAFHVAFGSVHRGQLVAVLAAPCVVVGHQVVEIGDVVAFAAIERLADGVDADDLRQAVAKLRLGQHGAAPYRREFFLEHRYALAVDLTACRLDCGVTSGFLCQRRRRRAGRLLCPCSGG